jgi:hypothetical protein
MQIWNEAAFCVQHDTITMNTIRFLGIALFVVSALYLLPHTWEEVNVYDEGIILAGAERILQGDIPLRDFWTIYPPGQFYAVAALFRVFEPSVIVERIYDIAVKALLSVTVFFLILRFSRSTVFAGIGWLMSLAFVDIAKSSGCPIFPAILFSLLGVFFLSRYVSERRTTSMYWSAACIVAAALFRHDLGFYAAAAALLTLITYAIVDQHSDRLAPVQYAGALLVFGLPIAAFFVWSVGFDQLVELLVWTPGRIIPAYRWLPYPHLMGSTIKFYFFPLVSLVACISVIVSMFRREEQTADSYTLLFLSLTGIFFLNQLSVRSEDLHLIPSALVSVVTLPLCVALLRERVRNAFSRTTRRIALIVFLVIVGKLTIDPLIHKVKAFSREYRSPMPEHNVARGRYAALPRDLVDIVNLLRDSTGTQTPMYVGVKNHDRFMINDVVVYFLAKRAYGTRYHELHPGIASTRAVQEEIINELASNGVKTIILTSRMWEEPNQTRNDDQIDTLDRFISSRYQFVWKMGEYELWNKGADHVAPAPAGSRK